MTTTTRHQMRCSLFLLLLMWHHHSFALRRFSISSSVQKDVFTSTSSSLFAGTNAKPSSESIEPAKFNKDLYGVLGVSRGASKEEIRAAYMSIVNMNHPDRNSSDVALEIFRNASYAYKTLVKDDKALLLSAETFVNSIGEVGEDVLKPLATEVALPLLNMTVRGIGNVARPLVQDIGDMTKAVMGAAFEDSTGLDRKNAGSATNTGTLNKIVNAYKKTSNQQNANRLNQNLERTQRRITETLEELQNANELNVQLKNTVTSLSTGMEAKNTTANLSFNNFLQSKEVYAECKRKLSLVQFNLKEKENQSSNAKKKVEDIDISIATTSTKIQGLERALEVERRLLREYTSSKAEIDSVAKECEREETNIKKEYEDMLTITDESQIAMEDSKRVQLDAAIMLNEDLKALDKAQTEGLRQVEFISIVERKLKQLQEKKIVLHDLLKETIAANTNN